ncbi:MAG: hypothetical protein H6999_08125 [Hahellaceae bacterium]|nr:hypothetical protein [Hahellaceae bacterium]MCP5169710.1 hypothetical protein [Hahellaceae bacterium]
MRLQLDNRKTYDVNAMFRPSKVGRATAWGIFSQNLSAWPKGLVIPFEFQVTRSGLRNWFIVFSLHTLSLLLLPLLCLFGYSTRAYAFFTKEDDIKLQRYRIELQQVYAKLSHIEDQDEYQSRLKEEIAKIKPF